MNCTKTRGKWNQREMADAMMFRALIESCVIDTSEIGRGHWPAEQPALPQNPFSGLSEILSLFFGFNAFYHHQQIQPPSHV